MFENERNGLRAEWVKFRTTRGWVIGMLVAGVLIMVPGPLVAVLSQNLCTQGTVEVACPVPPVGPGGESVEDRFFFLNQQLDGDGSITVRVGPMTGRIKEVPAGGPVGPGADPVPGVVPWAKAGIMIKESVVQGAPYVAVMTTSEHGVRMQHDFTEDTAGSTSDRWLRLTRTGATITGYESADGTQWTPIGTAELAGPARVGLFAASPGHLNLDPASGLPFASSFAEVTAGFDELALQGATGEWSRDDIGVEYEPDGKTPHHPGGVVQSGDTFTLTGVGDIGPLLAARRIEQTLIGLLPGLVVMIVVAVLFSTADYRRGLVDSTPPSRVLMAKAAVIAGTAAATGLVAAAVALVSGTALFEANGTHLLRVSLLTEVRVVVGAAAFCAAVAVLAVGIGTLFRRAVLAIVAAIAVVALPYLLAVAAVLPDPVVQWVLRLTPAAGFAILQSIPAYPQVLASYVPSEGYYPLPPWAGLAVVCGCAALALGLAVGVRRRVSAVPSRLS